MAELPFAQSTVERIIKENISEDQAVSSRVKIAMNAWLGELTTRVAKEMAKSQSKSLTLEDFQKAVHKYELAGKLVEEKKRVSERIDATNRKISEIIQDFEKSIVKKDEDSGIRIVQLHDELVAKR